MNAPYLTSLLSVHGPTLLILLASHISILPLKSMITSLKKSRNWKCKCISSKRHFHISQLTSLGALRAPNSSCWPFGPAWLRPSRPSAAQAVWPTQWCGARAPGECAHAHHGVLLGERTDGQGDSRSRMVSSNRIFKWPVGGAYLLLYGKQLWSSQIAQNI